MVVAFGFAFGFEGVVALPSHGSAGFSAGFFLGCDFEGVVALPSHGSAGFSAGFFLGCDFEGPVPSFSFCPAPLGGLFAGSGPDLECALLGVGSSGLTILSLPLSILSATLDAPFATFLAPFAITVFNPLLSLEPILESNPGFDDWEEESEEDVVDAEERDLEDFCSPDV